MSTGSKPASKQKTKPSALSIPVYDLKGKKVGRVQLPKEIVEAKINVDLMAQAIRVYQANQHIGTASTKTRGAVRASTRKLYRQKGTGRARAGSASAPQRVGGGVAHGPRPGFSRLQLPQKMRRRALWSALKQKASEGHVIGIDGLSTIKPKTKAIVDVLTKLAEGKERKGHTLLISEKRHEHLRRATQNVPSLELKPVQTVSTYDVLRARTMLVMREAVKGLSHA